MATRATYAGTRAACVLAAAGVAAVTVAAGGTPASAVTHPAPPHALTRVAAGGPRDIRFIRQLRKAGAPPAPDPAPARGAGRPQAIAIPAIGVRVPLVTLGGRTAPTDGNDLLLPVPPLVKASTEAGWYQFTAPPGTAGNAVVVGHVDTYAGAGVFYLLYQLKAGDAIDVTRDGTRQRFTVTSVREMSKATFPVNQVFGGTAKHQLWLITCGGAFDYQTGHYLDNIVVSAKWVPPVKSATPRPRKNNAPG